MNETQLTHWRLKLGLPATPPARQGPPRCDLSASKVKLLDKCDYAYYLGRIEKLDERPSDAQFRGLLCHRVLELVARPRLHQLRAGKPSAGELREALREEAARFKCSAPVIASAREILEDLADKLDFSNTVSIEENMVVEIPQDALAGPAFKLGAVVDRLDVDYDTEAGAHVAHIQDYKSGSYVASVGELMGDPQALFYVAIVRALGWAGPIRVTFHYLGAGQPTTFLAPEGMPGLGIDLAMTKMAEIRNKKEWKPVTGTHCVACDFRGSCPAYQSLVKSARDGSYTEAFPVESDTELLREYVRNRTLAKLFDDHKRVCGEALKAKLENQDKVIGGGFRAQMSCKRLTRLPSLDTVARVVGEAAEMDVAEVEAEIATVDERRLKDLIKRLDPERRARTEKAMEDVREHFDVTSSIDVRAIPGGF